mgnify:CR=1 FL=1
MFKERVPIVQMTSIAGSVEKKGEKTADSEVIAVRNLVKKS